MTQLDWLWKMARETPTDPVNLLGLADALEEINTGREYPLSMALRHLAGSPSLCEDLAKKSTGFHRAVAELGVKLANCSFSVDCLIGCTLAAIEYVKVAEVIYFTVNDGSKYWMYHSTDCCESVTVEDINGDLADLVGSPILLAEESTSQENPPGFSKEWQLDFTWTFYRFATAKGFVAIRWYGESDGGYSVKVDFDPAPVST